MSSLIGHEKIAEDLEFLIKKEALPHGFIFTGPAMTGKRTAALALANFLEHGVFAPPAEGAVLQDAKVIDLASMKLLDPETAGNSIGIDAAREIKNFLFQRPNASARRTLIIDDAAMMTNEAQNAILKITEEPPSSSLLILISSDAEGLLPTILSRLQKISFGTVSESEIEQWLSVDYAVPAAKAVVAAKKSFGKPGLAWRLIFDKTLGKNIELAEKFLKTTVVTRRDIVKKIIEPDDFNMRIFLDAVMLVLAWGGITKSKTVLWHKTLALYGRIANFSLNPHLQLENLLMEE
jgi:DNA polymerase-3 subunit delta'